MATRQCLRPLHRHYSSLFSSTTKLSHTLKTSIHTLSHAQSPQLLETPTSDLNPLNPFCRNQFTSLRHFSSQRRTQGPRDSESEEDDEDDDDDEDEDEEDDLSEEEDYDDNEVPVSKSGMKRVYSPEEKEKEAGEIGYKVIGPLDPTERPFKHREPYFAVVQIGSHQFKVSNGDYIYTERLKFCDVNDKLSLSKILMVGSKSQTIIGRPILPDATVHAVVEEHALDAKVIIFKKKRRKNYRRTKGHRQELTRLRITDIQGIEKPEKPAKPEKPERRERPEKVAVAA